MEMGAYTLRMSAKEKADKLNEMYELFPRLYERKSRRPVPSPAASSRWSPSHAA